MVFNLGIVLGFMFILLYAGKKLKLRKISTNKHVRIINVTPVGVKEKIILLEVNNTILLVGATPNHIETLYVFNELELPKSSTIAATDKKRSFSEQLAATLN